MSTNYDSSTFVSYSLFPVLSSICIKSFLYIYFRCPINLILYNKSRNLAHKFSNNIHLCGLALTVFWYILFTCFQVNCFFCDFNNNAKWKATAPAVKGPASPLFADFVEIDRSQVFCGRNCWTWTWIRFHEWFVCVPASIFFYWDNSEFEREYTNSDRSQPLLCEQQNKFRCRSGKIHR